MLDKSKQDAAIKAANSKGIIELLINRKLPFYDMSTTWDNTDSCVDNCICAT